MPGICMSPACLCAAYPGYPGPAGGTAALHHPDSPTETPGLTRCLSTGVSVCVGPFQPQEAHWKSVVIAVHTTSCLQKAFLSVPAEKCVKEVVSAATCCRLFLCAFMLCFCRSYQHTLSHCRILRALLQMSFFWQARQITGRLPF